MKRMTVLRHWLVGSLATVLIAAVAIAVLALGDDSIGLREALFGSAFFGVVFGGPVGLVVGLVYALARRALARRRRVPERPLNT